MKVCPFRMQSATCIFCLFGVFPCAFAAVCHSIDAIDEGAGVDISVDQISFPPVNRSKPHRHAHAHFESIEVIEGELNPKFCTSLFNYSVAVNGSVSSVRIITVLPQGKDYSDVYVRIESDALKRSIVSPALTLRGSNQTTSFKIYISSTKLKSSMYLLSVHRGVDNSVKKKTHLFEKLLVTVGVFVGVVLLWAFFYSLVLCYQWGYMCACWPHISFRQNVYEAVPGADPNQGLQA